MLATTDLLAHQMWGRGRDGGCRSYLCCASAHAGPPARGNSIFGKRSVLGRVRDEKAFAAHMEGLQSRQPLQREEPALWK